VYFGCLSFLGFSRNFFFLKNNQDFLKCKINHIIQTELCFDDNQDFLKCKANQNQISIFYKILICFIKTLSIIWTTWNIRKKKNQNKETNNSFLFWPKICSTRTTAKNLQQIILISKHLQISTQLWTERKILLIKVLIIC